MQDLHDANVGAVVSTKNSNTYYIRAFMFDE